MVVVSNLGDFGGPLRVSTAHACSCTDPAENVALYQESADASFLGTLVEIRPPEVALSSTAESRFIFEVDKVFKGDSVRRRQSIVSVSSGASCGIELPLGATAVVFGRRDDFDVTPDDGEFASGLCQVIPQPSDAVLASLGTGRPPEPGASPIGADDGVASTVVRNWYWPVALLVVGVAAAVLLRRGRRHGCAD